jgi:cytochrome c biogenesis protein CcmG, thiol:disulfide interchange protein DsbE
VRRWGIRIGVSLVTVVTVVLTVAFASRFGTDPRLSPSPLIGSPVPDVVVHRVPDGSALTLADLQGEIVVVNFWAPWCLPCRDEHPDLVAVAEAFADAGVRVLGIAYQSDVGHVVQYLDELGWGFDVAMDDRSRAAIAFGIRGVPETFFVDRDGLVAAKVTGPVNAAIMTDTIERLIVGAPVDPGTTTGTVQPAP